MISRNRRSTSSSRSGPCVALARRAQHLRLALGPVEVDRAPAGGLGDADLLREPRALADQRVDLLIDRVDARAHGLEVRPQRLGAGDRRGLPARVCFVFCQPWIAAPLPSEQRAPRARPRSRAMLPEHVRGHRAVGVDQRVGDTRRATC